MKVVCNGTGKGGGVGVGVGEARLDQWSCVHQAFVGVQAGEEADVPVLVRLQSHHSLFQLVRVGTAGLLEVRCVQNTQFSHLRGKPSGIIVWDECN